MFRVKKKDFIVLITLIEYRLLNISQITSLHFSCKKVARRRLTQMTKEGLIEIVQRGFGRSRGRPENVYSISLKGIELLQKEDLLCNYAPGDKLDSKNIICIDHQLLVNWFRIHLVQIEKLLPNIEARFLSPNSPFQISNYNEMPLIHDKILIEGSNNKFIGFTPDGVFSINDKIQKKSLLFFLEVDMGTESLASPKRNNQDIRQKIINYQIYFRSNKYKRYEDIWKCHFNGFRLLFLTNNTARMKTLCQLIQEIPPSNFIWITEQRKMFSQGLADTIWVQGGNLDKPLKPIVGEKMWQPSPIPLINL